MQESEVATHIPFQKNDGMFYLETEAEWTGGCATKLPDELEVVLGDMDDDAARWWASGTSLTSGYATVLIVNAR